MEETNSFMFSRSFNFETKSNGDLIIKGAISSTDLDLVNDICTLNCLKSMKSQIEERNMKLDAEHEAFRGNSTEEKEINKTIIPVGRMYNPKITEKKNGYDLEVEAVINSHTSRFSEIKGSIEGKFLDAFSIAFIPTRTKTVVKDGEQIRMLDDVALLNVALTGNPVNTHAQMKEIVAKSIKTLEEYKTKKLTNPEIAEKLEVKSEVKESGSDKEKRKLRNESLTDSDENEEEEEKGCNKYEKKAYEKDGGHSHDTDAIGEHTHPEIEKRINGIWDYIYNSMKEETSIKSHSNENSKSIQKEVKKMTEDEIKETEVVTPVESEAPVEKPAEESSEPVSEIKSMIESLSNEVKSLKAKLEAKDEEPVKVKEVKANSKAVITNDNSQSLGKEVKSVAGLNELF